MNGSGLEELLSEVYAENGVIHMISGKAVSRSLRGHLLVEASLISILLEELAECQLINLEPLKSFLEVIDDKSINEIHLFCHSAEVFLVEQALQKKMKELEQQSRTGKLWLLYIHYVRVLKNYIIAERTSNWALHLHATVNMLNLFAASGHINYAKSTRLYIQQMRALSETQPWLAEQFNIGKHAVTRSNRYWAGLWSDLVIEQTLMRSVKSRGGLTRSRGMKEGTRHLWAMSLNDAAAVHQAMNQPAGSTIKTTEQHVDLGHSGCIRDQEDWKRFKT